MSDAAVSRDHGTLTICTLWVMQQFLEAMEHWLFVLYEWCSSFYRDHGTLIICTLWVMQQFLETTKHWLFFYSMSDAAVSWGHGTMTIRTPWVMQQFLETMGHYSYSMSDAAVSRDHRTLTICTLWVMQQFLETWSSDYSYSYEWCFGHYSFFVGDTGEYGTLSHSGGVMCWRHWSIHSQRGNDTNETLENVECSHHGKVMHRDTGALDHHHAWVTHGGDPWRPWSTVISTTMHRSEVEETRARFFERHYNFNGRLVGCNMPLADFWILWT